MSFLNGFTTRVHLIIGVAFLRLRPRCCRFVPPKKGADPAYRNAAVIKL